MKILSPVSRVQEVLPLIEAGAQELYCGVVSSEWEKRFSFVASSNLRHDRAANFSSFGGLARAAEQASRHKVPLFCVFNAPFYSGAQLPLALRQAKQAVEAGASKLIVSDIGFIQALVEAGVPAEIVLSTGNPAFNSSALRFFKGMGVKRVVLPRQLTVEEISRLSSSAKGLGMQTEAFVLNAICPFVDGFCTLQHFGKSPDFVSASELACRFRFKAKVFSGAGLLQKRAALSRACFWHGSVPDGCGLCALPSFREAGVHSLKIAGRGNSLEKKLSDVRMLRQALSLLGSLPREGFFSEMKALFFRQNRKRCGFGSCYYPGTGMV